MKPGKWYGVDYSYKWLFTGLKSKKSEDGMLMSFDVTSFNISLHRPFGMYVGPQLICKVKGYATGFFLPEVNAKPTIAGPTSYKEFHTFLRPDNSLAWIEHELIEYLVELDEAAYAERLGCGDSDCVGLPINSALIVWGKGIKNPNKSVSDIYEDIIDPCFICAALYRKILKARRQNTEMVYPKHPVTNHNPTTGL